MPPTSDEFDVITPQGREVVIGGQPLLITPMTIAQIPPTMRAIKRIRTALGDSTNTLDLANLDPDAVLTLLADGGEDLIDAVVAATGHPLEVIGHAQAHEFVDLFAVVVEVNSDFFIQRVLPAFGSILQRVQAKAATRAKAGPGPIRLQR